MSFDRKKLLEQRSVAARMVRDPDLSDATRALAKKALDLADVALGLRDAAERKAERELAQSGEAREAEREPMPSEASPQTVLTDPPGPFSPPKVLQAYLDQWEGKPEATEPALAQELRQTRQALARWKAKGHPTTPTR